MEKSKVLGNRNNGSLDELMKKALDDPLIDEAMTGKLDEHDIVYSDRDGILHISGKVIARIYYLEQVTSLAIHDGKLLSCSLIHGIRDTLNHDNHEKICSGALASSICSYNNKLYVAEQTQFDRRGTEIFSEDERKQVSDVTCLCSHNGRLLYSTHKGKIYDFNTSKLFWSQYKAEPIGAMCSNNKALYFSVYDKVFRCSNVLEEIAKAKSNITGLCIHNGSLLYCGDFGIYEAGEGFVPDKYIREGIKPKSIISVPRRWLIKYYEHGGMREIEEPENRR